ncbi:MAG TPA: tetratricopeptide repeat protein [Clostridia bacterium]|nr:tetratricopeptide repeat protein [Clostridia bacterium]
MKRITTALLILIVASTASFAQFGNELQVRVRLAYGGDFSGLARVELFKGDMPWEHAYANSRGEVLWRGLPEGSYLVRVTLPGFTPEDYPVELYGSSSRTISLTLHADPNSAPADTAPSLDDPLVSVRFLAAPDGARKELQKARESRLKGDCKGALDHGRKATEIAPDFVLAYLESGLCQERVGELDAAQNSFETALAKDPKYLYSYLNLARVQARKKDYNGAAKTLALAAKAQPDRGEPFFEMARIQLDTGHTDVAEKAAKMALGKDWSHIPEMPFLLANIYVRQGDTVKAISSLQEFVDKAPNGPQADRAKRTIEQLKQTKKNFPND